MIFKNSSTLLLKTRTLAARLPCKSFLFESKRHRQNGRVGEILHPLIYSPDGYYEWAWVRAKPAGCFFPSPWWVTGTQAPGPSPTVFFQANSREVGVGLPGLQPTPKWEALWCYGCTHSAPLQPQVLHFCDKWFSRTPVSRFTRRVIPAMESEISYSIFQGIKLNHVCASLFV